MWSLSYFQIYLWYNGLYIFATCFPHVYFMGGCKSYNAHTHFLWSSLWLSSPIQRVVKSVFHSVWATEQQEIGKTAQTDIACHPKGTLLLVRQERNQGRIVKKSKLWKNLSWKSMGWVACKDRGVQRAFSFPIAALSTSHPDVTSPTAWWESHLQSVRYA